MSDDPLLLGGLTSDALEPVIEEKKKRGNPIAAKNAETAAKREERLQTSGRASSKPPPEPEPPPVKDRSALLDKIGLFRERFPHLKSRNKVSARSAIEEIEDELHYIEQQLGSRDGHIGGQMLCLVMTGIEEASKHYNPLNLNLAGLGAVTRDNQDQFMPILDELFIKYGAQMYVGPEMRLAMTMATMIYTVHAANSGNPQLAAAFKKAAASANTSKGKDL